MNEMKYSFHFYKATLASLLGIVLTCSHGRFFPREGYVQEITLIS